MRKKLLSLLVLLMVAVTGAWAETTIVTWTSSGSYENNNSRGGVTLSGEVVEYIWDELSGGEWRLAYDSEQGTFTTSLGNFTSIVISGGDIDGFSGTGWNGRTWTGNASSVPFTGYLTDVYGEEPWTITFTIAPAEPASAEPTTYNVTFRANGNTKVVENVTLPHTFSCYYNGSIGVGDGELDLIIQELYGFSGGWCDESSPWMDNAVSGVTVGISSDNQYFSISTPFEGTAQLKGWYYRGWEDDFVYTLDIAIAAVEPEPEPQPAGYAVSLKAETADEGNWTAKAGEGEYQSLPLEGVAEGTQVSLKYAGLKKVKSVKAVKKASAEPAGPTAYTLAESTQGMIVGTDGKAYAVADKDNLPSGVTAAGVVVYKDGSNGLAIALTDEASMMDWATACGESGAAAHTPTVEGQTWKLPSQEEWTLVKNANSGSSLNSAITNAGGTAIPTVHFDHETQTMTGQYWLSTQGAIDESARTWGINVYDEIAVGSQSLKTDNLLVRACLAW